MAELDSPRLSRSSPTVAYSAARGRRFALTLAGAFGVLAVLTLWRGSEWLPVILGVPALLFAIAAAAVPARLEPFESGWMRIAHAISRVTTPVFMGIVYFLVLTPAGFLRRTLGRTPLVRLPTNGSYWIPRSEAPPESRRKRMERQF